MDHWLEQQAHSQGWTLKVQVYWLPQNASWFDQIENLVQHSAAQAPKLVHPHFSCKCQDRPGEYNGSFTICRGKVPMLIEMLLPAASDLDLGDVAVIVKNVVDW